MSQFYCVKCEKWFRQPIVFRRHQRECTAEIVKEVEEDEEGEEEEEESNSGADEVQLNKNGKRKNSSDNMASNSQENKRTRLIRTASAIALTAFNKQETIKQQQQTANSRKRV